MDDLFSTHNLVAVVRDLRAPVDGLAATYFPDVVEETSEEIHFDVENKPRRLAPFVHPLVPGQIVKGPGFQTNTFKPAYIKDKRVFHPGRALKRVMGERLGGGGYTPQERMQILLVTDMQDQIAMIERRLEWMAAQILVHGSVTITGDYYQATVVDFGRDATLEVTLSGGARWGETGVKPLDDLQDWSDRMVKKSGVGLTRVTMTVDAWKLFRANDDVKERLDRFRGNSTLRPDAVQNEGLVFMGMVDQFAIYVHNGGWYIDPVTGAETAMLPPYTVIGSGAPEQVEGVRAFGAILDVDVLRAMPYYPKSWTDEDPSMRYLLMQSAPLLVPYRPNATFRATVR